MNELGFSSRKFEKPFHCYQIPDPPKSPLLRGTLNRTLNRILILVPPC